MRKPEQLESTPISHEDVEKTCAIVGAAPFARDHFLQQRFDLVIAADRGILSLRGAGVEPDVALGDFDSLGYVPQHGNVVRHPVMKDASDTMLALQYAYDLGYRRMVVYGALGGRLDHTQATLQSLVHFARLGATVCAVGESEMVAVLRGGAKDELRLPAWDGGVFSVFAASDSVCGLTEQGSLYELEGAELSNDSSLGLSNEFVGKPVTITVTSGDLLVFFPHMPVADV